ncbi:glycosyltransferase family 2 protein [Methylobacterium trifolii]
MLRHPGRAFAILRARLSGKRLRARQSLAALVGIDHRLTLPSEILDRFPAAAAGWSDAGIHLLCPPGHRLVEGAQARIVAAFADPSLQALYGDALVQFEAGGPVLPLLRPAFDPVLLLGVDYIGPVLAVRRTALAAFETRPALEVVFRITERFGGIAIGHLPEVISLWRPYSAVSEPHGLSSPLRGGAGGGDGAEGTYESHPAPPPPLTPPRKGEGTRAPDRSEALSTPSRVGIVRAHLDRTGFAASRLAFGPEGVIDIAHPLPDPLPLASMIVPTRDRLDLLRPCIASLSARTDWPAFEILICDNDSREPETLAYFRALEAEGSARIVPCPGPFNFAAMNNRAAGLARGRLLVFVNNDVEAFEPDWLTRLAREALRPDVGAVGAKLLDGESRIQHAGIVLGTGGLVTHGHRHFPTDAPGYLSMLRATHEVSAVTAACLAVETEKFAAVGGFDQDKFAVDFNDVDLCLRLNREGYRTLLVPGAVLHHREAASRRWTPQARARHAAEVANLKERWGPLLAQDPHYHPGFDPDLSTHARLRGGRLWQGAPGVVRRSPH